MSLQDLRYWFEDLELRKKLEENQAMVSIGLIILIFLCLSLVVCQLVGGGGTSSITVQLVYYDLDSKQIKLVEHKYPETPASPLEDSTNVFLASVYACEECPKGTLKEGMSLDELKANGMFVAYLERTDLSVPQDQAMFDGGHSYRSLENDQWYSAGEAGYEKIISDLYARCPKAKICMP